MSTITVPLSSTDSRMENIRPESSEYKRLRRANISVFKNAPNPVIKNSAFIIDNTTNVNASGGKIADSLDVLNKRVARNGILNAGGRADEVKCYPGTREEVISLIESWMDGKDGIAPSHMMWLSGPAGAGKSAIVQTITERCKERGVQVASFFFFRADPTRSTAQPLVATLLYQIFTFCPPVRQAVATILSEDPLLFDGSIHDQFKQLLASPLQDFRPSLKPHACRPIVLLIDGLDECDSAKSQSQRQILQALDHLLMQNGCPFMVLVASRAEPHITMAVKELTSPVRSIFLDDQYTPEKDIRLFVTAEFRRIKKSHHLAHMLNDNWPSDEDIESIVKKSSGQFIFAATVMRFIANSSASPKLSMERVRGIQPVATNSPFVHLDAIYKYILSRADDREAVMDHLSMELLLNDVYRGRLSYRTLLACVLGTHNPRYTPELLDSCLSDLTAIMQIKPNELVIFHASLPDFLLDKSRSGEFYIDLSAFSARILPAIAALAPKSMTTHTENAFVLPFFGLATALVPDTTKTFPFTVNPHWLIPSDGSWNEMLDRIHQLYYPHDVKSYKKVIRQWAFWYVRIPAIGWTYRHEATAKSNQRLPYVMEYLRIARMNCTIRNLLRTHFRFKERRDLSNVVST